MGNFILVTFLLIITSPSLWSLIKLMFIEKNSEINRHSMKLYFGVLLHIFNLATFYPGIIIGMLWTCHDSPGGCFNGLVILFFPVSLLFTLAANSLIKRCIRPRNSETESSADNPSFPDSRNKWAAGLLAIFLGNLGVHKLYLGYKYPAYLYFFSTIITAILSKLIFGHYENVFLYLIAIISKIEGVIYLWHSENDFKDKYINNTKHWF